MQRSGSEQEMSDNGFSSQECFLILWSTFMLLVKVEAMEDCIIRWQIAFLLFFLGFGAGVKLSFKKNSFLHILFKVLDMLNHLLYRSSIFISHVYIFNIFIFIYGLIIYSLFDSNLVHIFSDSYATRSYLSIVMQLHLIKQWLNQLSPFFFL